MKKRELERVISSFFNRKHCILLGSGTTSLYVIFRALDLPQNSKVIYPDITCETALNAAIYAGLTPLFCDIDLKTFNLALDRAVDICSDEVGAIVPTHIFGNIFDIAELKKRLGDRDVFLVEDAAQSFGGVLSGRKTGGMGDASIISFGDGKTIDCGGGGAVLTDSDEFYERCLEASSHLGNDHSARVALKNEFMKEMFKLNKNFKDRASFIEGRDELKQKYKDAYVFNITEQMVDDIARAFGNIDGILAGIKTKAAVIQKLLSCNTKTTLPTTIGEPVYWRYSFLIEGNRDAVFDKLIECKINASRFFSPLHIEYNLPDEDYPNSIRLFDKIINVRLDFAEPLARKIAETLDSTIDKYAA